MEPAAVLEHPTRSRARRPQRSSSDHKIDNRVASSVSTNSSSTTQTLSTRPSHHAKAPGLSIATSLDISTIHKSKADLISRSKPSIEPPPGSERSAAAANPKLATVNETSHVRDVLRGLSAYHREKTQSSPETRGLASTRDLLIEARSGDPQSQPPIESQLQGLTPGTYLVRGRDLVRLTEHENAIFEEENLLVCSEQKRYFWQRPELKTASADYVVYKQRAIRVVAGYEQEELISVLNSTIVYHLGPRRAFDLRKARLYMVYRREKGFIIEEKVFNSSNLCSGFVFVVLSSAKTCLWHGKGADDKEVQAGREFILSYTSSFESLQEASEDQSFWKLFGSDTPYARASYWELRKHSCYRSILYLESDSGDFEQRKLWTAADLASTALTRIIDAYFEIYITVPNHESSMKFALQRAIACINTHILKDSVDRPFLPVILLLCHNSRLPRDLQVIVPFAQHGTRYPLRLFEANKAMKSLEQGLSSRFMVGHA